jgi:hypothetical protein
MQPGPFSIDHFARAAQACADGYVKIEGESIVAVPTASPFTRLDLARQKDAGDTAAQPADPHAVFMQALRQRFGTGIANSVIKELDLHVSPGRPLPCATITRALNMGRVSQQALAGVDFITQLSLSATAGTQMFMDICARAGIDPASLSTAQRARIDLAMRARFEQAEVLGLCPTEPAAACAWLAAIVKEMLGDI